MAKRTPSKLAIHGGKPVKTTPFGKGPKHGLEEWKAIKPLFERGSIQMTRGPEVMALREKFCKLFGMRYAVTASSGTAALHTAMGALEIGRGDEVITSPITDMGTLTAILQQNAVPVFADVDPDTLMITPETVEEKITPQTKAIIVVHLAGLPADMRGIMRVAKRYELKVVEDMAQSYLTTIGKKFAGTFGDIGCWSLNESKHIGAGDGGILLTNKKSLAERGDLFADKCYDRVTGDIDPFFAPYNYRLNTLTAAVCLEQLKKVKKLCRRRNQLGTRLDKGLAGIEGVSARPVPDGVYATYWYYVLHMDPDVLGCTRDEFCEAVSAEGVGLGRFKNNVLEWTLFQDARTDPWACSHSCPLFKGHVPEYNMKAFPGLQRVMDCSIKTGLSEYYTVKDIDAMVRAIRKVADWYRSKK